jgi:hypothetical protein
MRGDAYDGRGFVKAMTGGPTAAQPAKRQPDVDIDMKLGAVVGFNGEALRSLELKMSRRAGEVRSLGLNAKIGRNATLTAGLHSKAARQVIDVETGDAGALFRFTDVYSRMNGGQMTIAMDPPSANNPAQQGTLNVHDFAVHDEGQFQHAVLQNGAAAQHNVMNFYDMRIAFTRAPGRVALRDGVVRGPLLGATIDGSIDYSKDEVHLRGTLVPPYGPNNFLGMLPVVGLFLGGEKEGLVGTTYEVVGKPDNPVLHFNPISALAPGLLRKVFEFPTTSPYVPPAADDSTTDDNTTGTNGNR